MTGMYASKGKYAVNAAFILSAFGITAAAGMPSGTPGFIADTGLAAALYPRFEPGAAIVAHGRCPYLLTMVAGRMAGSAG